MLVRTLGSHFDLESGVGNGLNMLGHSLPWVVLVDRIIVLCGDTAVDHDLRLDVLQDGHVA